MTPTMSEEEQHEWMLLYVSDKKTHAGQTEYSVIEIAHALGMTNDDGNTEITGKFWTDHETKYLKGEMFEKKLPIVNLLDRLNAVEMMMKLNTEVVKKDV